MRKDITPRWREAILVYWLLSELLAAFHERFWAVGATGHLLLAWEDTDGRMVINTT